MIGTAFDRAWTEIEDHFGDTDAELARSRLAEAVLIVAGDQESLDIAALKTEALQVLALTYRRPLAVELAPRCLTWAEAVSDPSCMTQKTTGGWMIEVVSSGLGGPRRRYLVAIADRSE